MNGKIPAFYIILPNWAKLCMSAVRAVPTGSQPTSLRYSQDYYTILEMNLYSKMKKKFQKNKKILKKKIVMAAELVAARALLMAGGNMVDKLSEDTAPQISASEVTWNQDQGTALFEIKTVQKDSGISNWAIGGYVVLALGMIILAIPAIKVIKWIIKSCGDRTRTYSIDEEEVENKKKPIGKYSAVMYTPSSVETEATGYNFKSSTSMTMLQDKLEQEISVLTKESRKDECLAECLLTRGWRGIIMLHYA